MLSFSALVSVAHLHFYWAFGGHWGIDYALPKSDTQTLAKPGRAITVAVALFLFFCAGMILVRLGLFGFSRSITAWIDAALAVLFFLRALGGFIPIGFLIKLKGSKFAFMDLRVYSPLCFFLAATFLVLMFRSYMFIPIK